MRPLFWLAISSLFAPLALLAEDLCLPGVAQLNNGFEMRYLRHEMQNSTVRLYLSEGGYIDIPQASIVSLTEDANAQRNCPEQSTDGPTKPDARPNAGTNNTGDSSGKTIDQHVTLASDASGIDEDFLRSVIRQESGFNPRARSSKGAQGLMQLMPGTAKTLGVKDAYDPESNLRGGSQYLRDLLVKYNGDAIKALAAYNAGPGAVERYGGVPPYRETQLYIARIITEYNLCKKKERAVQAQNAATVAPTATSAKTTPSTTKRRKSYK